MKNMGLVEPPHESCSCNRNAVAVNQIACGLNVAVMVRIIIILLADNGRLKTKFSTKISRIIHCTSLKIEQEQAIFVQLVQSKRSVYM